MEKIIHKKTDRSLFFAHPFLFLLSIIWLAPLFWLVINSFRGESGAYINYFFPKKWTFDNYILLFTDKSIINFPKWYLNTIIVSICTCIISTIFVLGTSFAFSRMRFKMRRPMMNVILILGMFPGFMSMIAVYLLLQVIFNALNIDIANLGSLVIIYSASAGMGYYICKGFFDTIPKSLDEAAMIDGANKNTVFWKVIIPLSKPIIVYTILMAFMGPWMDFIFARVIMKGDIENLTVASGLWTMLQREYIDKCFTRFCAGAVLVAIPITLVFIFLQKFYVSGVTGGADKG